jgi:hypothetical protein
MFDWFDAFDFLWTFGRASDPPGDIWLVIAVLLMLLGISLGIWVDPWWFMLCIPAVWIMLLFVKHRMDQWRDSR